MKRLLLIWFLCTAGFHLFCTPGAAIRPADTQQEIDSLKTEVAHVQRDVKGVNKLIVSSVIPDLAEQREKIDQLQHAQTDTLKAIYEHFAALQDEQKKQSDILSQNQQTLMQLKESFGAFRKWTLWMQFITIACLLLLAGWFFYTSRKRANSTLRQLQQSQDRIEEQVGRCNRMLSAMPQPSAAEEPIGLSEPAVKDHSLVIKIADEIARIENNLVRMDASVKGYRQVSKSVERIKGNLQAYGYEIVDMLGKPYDEGMKAIANFVYDATLAQGQQVITSIIKPQINYNGEMIQSSQITVSQNI